MPTPTVWDLSRKISCMKSADPMGLLIAAHESGHAIAALAVGCSVRRLALEYQGEAVVSAFCDLDELPQDPDDHLLYLAAGAAAEMLMFPCSFDRLARDDGLSDDVAKASAVLRDAGDFSGDVWASTRFLRAFHKASRLMESETIICRYLAVALYQEKAASTRTGSNASSRYRLSIRQTNFASVA